MAKLVIFGAGDIARLAHHYFTHDSPHEVAAFVVDRAFRTATSSRACRWSTPKTRPSGFRPATTTCSWP